MRSCPCTPASFLCLSVHWSVDSALGATFSALPVLPCSRKSTATGAEGAVAPGSANTFTAIPPMLKVCFEMVVMTVSQYTSGRSRTTAINKSRPVSLLFHRTSQEDAGVIALVIGR